MARLQILELPEGTGDERPPFVLVVDQCEPQRVILSGGGARIVDEWQGIADRIGARGVVVTPETVEIPANEVTAEFRAGLRDTVADVYEAARASLVGSPATDTDRMDQVTDALGLDRLRDWDEIVSAAKRVRDGGHLFGEPGHLDPQRCAACGVDRGAWLSGRDRRTCREIAVRGL